MKTLFLLRAKLAELNAQLRLWLSGLGQPYGRHIGDDLGFDLCHKLEDEEKDE
jgi:hypothetical protein